MDLEKRVQRLEDDVNILKNQVRNTLLDIQEQLSVHYHPSLRSKRAQRAARDASSAPKDVEEPEDAPCAEHDDDSGPPKVKRVSLEEIRHAPREGVAAPEGVPPAADAARPKTEGRADTGLYTELLQWASASIDTIGPEHTRRILETYASDGHLAPGLAESVIRLAALSSSTPTDREPSLQETLEALRTLNEVLAGATLPGAGSEGRRG